MRGTNKNSLPHGLLPKAPFRLEKGSLPLCAIFAISIMLGGCSSLKSHKSNLPLPQSHRDTWTPPKRERQTFVATSRADEILKQSGGKLDLPMLLDIAFEHSPTTKKSWHAAKIAAAQKGKATSVFFPSVVVSGTASKAETNAPFTKSLATTFYPSIELQCSIFKFGGHANTASAAKQLLYAANYNHNRELQTLAHNVQKCYFVLDTAEAGVEASKKSLDDAYVAYDAAFVRHQSGLTNIQDFLQAKASKARAEFDFENAKAKVESARSALANAIGIMFPDNLQIARTNDDDNCQDFEVDIHDLINETLHTRQDVLAQQAAVTAKKKLLYSSCANLAPELVIGASGNKKYYQHIDGNFDSYNIFASIRWKVFDGFSNFYEIIESKSKLKQAEHELQQLQLRVASDVWAKFHAFKSAIKQLHAARNYEQASQESFDSMVISYKNGLSSFNDLMSAQTQLAAARQQTITSKNTVSMAVVDLAYVAGIVNFNQKK